MKMEMNVFSLFTQKKSLHSISIKLQSETVKVVKWRSRVAFAWIHFPQSTCGKAIGCCPTCTANTTTVFCHGSFSPFCPGPFTTRHGKPTRTVSTKCWVLRFRSWNFAAKDLRCGKTWSCLINIHQNSVCTCLKRAPHGIAPKRITRVMPAKRKTENGNHRIGPKISIIPPSHLATVEGWC